jgi:hypothetical protein
LNRFYVWQRGCEIISTSCGHWPGRGCIILMNQGTAPSCIAELRLLWAMQSARWGSAIIALTPEPSACRVGNILSTDSRERETDRTELKHELRKRGVTVTRRV